MLDYRVDTFLSVCNHMNYTKAAEELHLAQSTVSLHISSLEEYYGAKLFGIEGKKVFITDVGKLVLDALTLLKRDEERLKKKIISAKGMPVRLGATLSVAENILCQPLAKFLSGIGREFVQVDIDNTTHLLDKISAGELDAAFIEGSFSEKYFEGILYKNIPFALICSTEYSKEKKMKSLKDLFSIPLLLREKGSGSRQILESILEKNNYGISDFEHIIEIRSIHIIKEMLKENLGVSFLYENVVDEDIKKGILSKISLKDMDKDFSHDIYYVWRKGSIYEADYRSIFHDLTKEEKPL